MLLESLLECVNEIRARIEAHGDALRKSETQTRYALIDPLLRELGWDTQEPGSATTSWVSQPTTTCRSHWTPLLGRIEAQ